MDHRTPLVAASKKNEKTKMEGVEPVVVVVVTVKIDCRLAQPGASTGSILPTTLKLVNQAMHPIIVLLVLVLLVGQFLDLPLRPAQVLLGIISALALGVHMFCSMQSLSASLAE